MNDLLEAVEALTRIRHVQIDTDDGPRWVTGEPRLIQLQEAITSTIGNGGGSGGMKSERSLLDPDALYRGAVITSQIGDWCLMVNVKPMRDPLRDLDRWHAKVQALPGAWDASFYIEQLQKWAREIDGMFDRPKPIDVTVPCPVCGAREYKNDAGDICVWPLKAQASPMRVECKSCGITWDGPDAAEELADEIGSAPLEKTVS